MNIFKISYKLYSKEVWFLTIISFIFVARKTVFNVSRAVGDYSVSIDSGTSLALVGISLGIIILIKNSDSIKRFQGNIFSYTLYYILAISSILWAGNASTILFKAIEVLVCFYLICLTIYKINNIEKTILYAILFSTGVSATDFFTTIIKLGINALHTNAYTMSAMIALLLALTSIKLKIFPLSLLKYIIVFNASMILVGTSGASYISTIIGLLFLAATTRKGINIIGVSVLSLFLYIIYDAYSEDVISLLFPGRSLEAVESGTGRKMIWEACINSWNENPFLGKGFIIGERNLGYYGLGHNALSAHNSFFSVLVNTGIIGMIVFISFLYKWISRVYQLGNRNHYANVLFPAMIAAIVNCNACPALGTDWGYVASCMYCLIAISFIILRKQQVYK